MDYATVTVRAEAADGEYIEHELTIRKYDLDKLAIGALAARVAMSADSLIRAEGFRTSMEVTTGSTKEPKKEPDDDDEDDES